MTSRFFQETRRDTYIMRMKAPLLEIEYSELRRLFHLLADKRVKLWSKKAYRLISSGNEISKDRKAISTLQYRR